MPGAFGLWLEFTAEEVSGIWQKILFCIRIQALHFMNQEHLVNFRYHILRRNSFNQRTITLDRRRVMLGGIYFNERTGLNTGILRSALVHLPQLLVCKRARVRGDLASAHILLKITRGTKFFLV